MNDCSLRQAIEKIEYHKYTAVPVLNKRVATWEH